MNKDKKPLLIVVSGCSGVGKDAILVRMKELGLPYFYAVTATSRQQRPIEVDGVDYLFIENDLFEEMIENGNFLEWANVYGNLYGVPKTTVDKAMKEGKDAIVKVDIQGAATIKSVAPYAVTIFISPPSMEELKRRLVQRKTESDTDLDLRLKTAQKEMDSIPIFDHVVVNHKDRIDQAIAEIEAIIEAERYRQ